MEKNNINYFLGASTPMGFVSFFSELYDTDKQSRCYVIKGGPGTGKSTLMKNIANFLESKKYTVKRVHCSSDPNSLDAVICDELNVSIADGTAPHVIEPIFPGAVENIINLGDYWDSEALNKNRDKIIETSNENSFYHARCKRFLSAAGLMKTDSERLAADALCEYKLNGYADRFSKRRFKKQDGIGRESKIFLSAITPLGVVFYPDTMKHYASEIIGIEDNTAAASSLLLERIKTLAIKNGYDVISAFCPLSPKGGPEHIIIPELSLAFIRKHSVYGKIEYTRTIHCSRFFDKTVLAKSKNRMAFNAKIQAELVDEAVLSLKKAKSVHDELEKLYMPHMNFDKFDKLQKKIISDMMK